MSHPALELQVALISALKADSDLVAVLAPDGIRDGPTRGAAFPYVAIGDWSSRDVGAQDWPGREHRLSLTVWSRAGGRAEVLDIMERIRVISDGISRNLGAHALVNLARVEARVARGRDGRSWRGTLVLRAVTEPLN
jgi:Protein of unknown function (DUF3168)